MRPARLRLRLSLCSLLLAALGCGLAWAGRLEIQNLRVTPREVRTYERLTISFDLSQQYTNPYDPEEVAVWAELRGPDGTVLRIPGFWFEPYEPVDEFTRKHVFTNPGRERYRRVGSPCWQVRVALLQPGRWMGQVVAKDATGIARSQRFSVVCLPGREHGFLQVAGNGQFLVFGDGMPFVPIGFCIAWARGNGEKDTYDYYFSRLARAGGNAARVWMCHWAWLEWTRGEKGALRGYEGVGRYNQQIAYNFDRILQLAERHGIYLQICFNNGCWEFGRPDGRHEEYDSWGGNPYNATNGGPCKQPGDFWTSLVARRLYKNKLRYIVARWGYSTHVMAWELWNEIGAENNATVAWHEEMVEYLHSTDPYKHLVTSSSWVKDVGELRRTWKVLDLGQFHYCTLADVLKARELFPRKPFIVGEGPWSAESMSRYACSLPLAGAAGPPLTWHSGVSSPVEKENWYPFIAWLCRTWRDFPAATESVTKLKLEVVEARASDGRRYAPVVIHPGFNTWLKRAQQAEFVVPPDGNVDTSRMSNRLYGSNPDRAPYRNPPTFVVDYPVAGEFRVKVGECSGPSVLVIRMDGKTLLRYQVPGSGRRHPPAAERWQSIEVPAGQHRIEVDNAGADWMAVGPFVLTNYRDATKYPPATALGIAAGGQARVWMSNDWAAAGPEQAPPAVDVSVRCSGLEGRWEVEWYLIDGANVRPAGRESLRGGEFVLRVRGVKDHAYAVLKQR